MPPLFPLPNSNPGTQRQSGDRRSFVQLMKYQPQDLQKSLNTDLRHASPNPPCSLVGTFEMKQNKRWKVN